MRYALLPLIAMSALAACDAGPINLQQADLQRAFANRFGDLPLDTGTVTVLTEEHGELHSYTFRPCGDGAVCSGHRRGHVEQAPDHTVISGTHAGRTFYLSPGGDGYLDLRGTSIPLAWEDPNPATILAPTRFSLDEIMNRTTG